MARVLVVDDDAAIRDTLRDLLDAEGYDVALACHGLEALESLRRQRADVVILDLRMPVMTGDELLAQLDADPDLCRIPVLILSANKDLPAHALRKPVDLDELLGAVAAELTPTLR